MIEILYFACLGERLGLDRERLTYPADVGTVASCLRTCAVRGPSGPTASARTRA